MYANKYLIQFLQRRSFIDFINAVKKSDPKEWTEVMGIFNQIRDLEDNNFDIVFDIGCGKRPSIGTFLALNMKSYNDIVCIDPQLDISLSENVLGLFLRNETLHDYINTLKDRTLDELSKKNALIICNHSHVSLKEIKEFLKLFKDYTYITCPCCVDNKLQQRGTYFKDKYVWTKKNEYYIFKKEGV